MAAPLHGHRIKNELDYSRGPEKTWVYGGLRVRDGIEVTTTAASRNSVNYQQFLQFAPQCHAGPSLDGPALASAGVDAADQGPSGCLRGRCGWRRCHRRASRSRRVKRGP
ncbi:hypothetical protein [Streptomyces sp. NBC_01304]|uniref:hypothetical protein n=1 Tax=Streptomyces sp. NBC_01304 TaxID=2903818 RepID=UPI002E1231EB|nr:hypothetical protein OG430_42545 [Streptomyces sp. NBC_01304]